MLATIREGWDIAVHVLQTSPLGFWPLIAGCLVSWGGTQWIKFFLPLSWSARARLGICRLIAFGLGFAVTYVLWPELPGAIAGVIVGVWAPFSYAVAARIVGWKFPALREAWSQDTREPGNAEP